MLKIRLQRIGRKNDPSFRVVVTEHTRGPKSENHVDRVGFYNPKTKDQKLEIEKIKHWLEKGAQASGTVHNMLIKAGVIKGDTVNVLPQKSPVVKEEEQKEETKAEAPEGEEAQSEEGDTPAEEEAPAEEEKKDSNDSAGEGEATEEEQKEDSAEESAEEEKKEDAA